jgi:hypothetical protein
VIRGTPPAEVEQTDLVFNSFDFQPMALYFVNEKVRSQAPNAYPLHREIARKGFMVVPDVLSDSMISTMLRLAKAHKGWETILAGEHVDGSVVRDTSRSYSIDNTREELLNLFTIGDRIKNKFLDKYYEIVNPIFLRSTPGGGRQQIHRDFPLNHISSYDKFYGLSIIIALEDDTTLHVYTRCLGNQPWEADHILVTIPRGSAIIFHGCLAHAGSKYNSMNYRIFMMAETVTSKHKEDFFDLVVVKN